MTINNNFFLNSVYFGVFITLITYQTGNFIKNKGKHIIYNPLLISVGLTAAFLLLFKIPYKAYFNGAKYIDYLLTPATVSLAYPLYEKINEIKKNPIAIMVGIICGTVSALYIVLVLCLIFKLDSTITHSLLPKSITTAIGIKLSEGLNGIPALTVSAIMISGIFGSICAPAILDLFKVKHPIAQGIGIGCSSHAMGTSKAVEMGEIQGAISSLALVICGIITVLIAGILFS